MANAVIVGTQWGDEGKEKVIDYLTQRSDLIIRFQGGANAGHTVIAMARSSYFILSHQELCIPINGIVGNGVVFDCEQFLKEIDELEQKYFCRWASVCLRSAHLVLHFIKHRMAPLNRTWDRKRSVPPVEVSTCLPDKASRTGIRVGDLKDWDSFVKTKTCFEFKKQLIKQITNRHSIWTKKKFLNGIGSLENGCFHL